MQWNSQPVPSRRSEVMQRVQHVPRRKWRRSIVTSLALLGLWRYWVTYDASLHVPSGPEAWCIAHSIVASGRFANPFIPMKTGPSAHLAPLFPIFLGSIVKVFGQGGLAVWIYQWGAAVAVILLVAALPVIAESLQMGFINGIFAALVWLLAKPFTFANWESSYAALLALTATYLFRKQLELAKIQNDRGNWLRPLLLGAIIGLLLLVSPACSAVVAVWLLWLFARSGRKSFLRYNVLLIVVPAVMLLPWAVRNYLVFHSVIAFRDSFGIALASSNNDCAAYSLRLNLKHGCYGKNPYDDVEAAREVAQMGEVRFNEARLRDAKQWIAHHPGRFLTLSMQRFAAFWFPNDYGVIKQIKTPGFRALTLIIYATTLSSFFGLFLLAQRSKIDATLCASWLILFPLVYYIVQSEDRYRYPILWLTFLLGCLPISRAAEAILHEQSVKNQDQITPAAAGFVA